METEKIKRGRGRPRLGGQPVEGHEISCSPDQWAALEKMAREQKISISRLIMKLAQIGALLSVVSCTSKSSYFPNGSDLSETNSKYKTAHYAKRLSRRTKRRGPSSNARYTGLSSRLFFVPLADGLPCRLSESRVMSISGGKK